MNCCLEGMQRFKHICWFTRIHKWLTSDRFALQCSGGAFLPQIFTYQYLPYTRVLVCSKEDLVYVCMSSSLAPVDDVLWDASGWLQDMTNSWVRWRYRSSPKFTFIWLHQWDTYSESMVYSCLLTRVTTRHPTWPIYPVPPSSHSFRYRTPILVVWLLSFLLWWVIEICLVDLRSESSEIPSY